MSDATLCQQRQKEEKKSCCILFFLCNFPHRRTTLTRPCLFVKEGSASLCGAPVSGLLPFTSQTAWHPFGQDTKLLATGACSNSSKRALLPPPHEAQGWSTSVHSLAFFSQNLTSQHVRSDKDTAGVLRSSLFCGWEAGD